MWFIYFFLQIFCFVDSVFGNLMNAWNFNHFNTLLRCSQVRSVCDRVDMWRQASWQPSRSWRWRRYEEHTHTPDTHTHTHARLCQAEHQAAAQFIVSEYNHEFCFKRNCLWFPLVIYPQEKVAKEMHLRNFQATKSQSLVWLVFK